MPYGTLITLYSGSAADANQVATLLTAAAPNYRQKQNTFFVTVTDGNTYRAIVNDLKAHGLIFTAIFLNDMTGSVLDGGNIAQADIDDYNDLLCIP